MGRSGDDPESFEPLVAGVTSAKIAVVDDEETNTRLLKTMLNVAGFRHVVATNDPRKTLELYEQSQPDLLILDLHMTPIDGFEVLSMLSSRIAATTYFPILVLTGDTAPDVKRRALGLGARDFLTKPFEVTELLLRVKNLLEARRLQTELKDANTLLEEKVRERTAHLWQTTRQLADAERQTRNAAEESIRRLAAAAEYRDQETAWHIERMSRYFAVIARRIGRTPEQCELLRLAASMHDIGKIGVPDRVLLKHGPLTGLEMVEMRLHTTIGHRILAGSQAEVIDTAATIALTHHERFDGNGYPQGLQGADIPLVGRIAAIADVFDALTSDRVYRPALAFGEAIERMDSERAGHFDPELLDPFLDSLEDVVIIRERYADTVAAAG